MNQAQKNAADDPVTAETTGTIASAEDVRKQYHLGKTIVNALKGVSLDVHRGEFLAISGPSGSGKTTLLNLMGCIELPSSGKVFIEGVDIAGLTDDQLASIRAHKLSFIFQNFNLLPVLSALENVEYPLLSHSLSSKDRRARALQALERVGLATHVSHKPMELSGGQRQRVAIARAIVNAPLLILADEPTANLDHKTGEGILDLMQEINQTQKTTFIFSTHDQKVMDRASRLVLLWDGLLRDE